jgi:hypothetical protein
MLMTPIIKVFALTICAAFLSSCATTRFISDVTNFHTLPEQGAGETFSITSKRGNSGIEVSQHLGKMAQGFMTYGWQRSSDSGADYRVMIDYGISDGRTVQGSRPIIGQTGGGTTYHSGNVSSYGGYGGYNSANYSGTSYTPATFGVVGAVPTTNTVYDRYLFVVIKNRSGANVLEGKVFSSGSSSNISEVLPHMIDSFFEDFPGVSGKSTKVTKQ